MNRNRIPAIFVSLILSLFFAISAKAGVVFSENYDKIQNGWNCSQPTPGGWTSKAGCSSDTYNGTAHYYGEISSGGRTGNSLKLWRHNGGFSDYGGYLNNSFTDAEFANHYKELYQRWYMKIPVGWDASLGSASTHKFSRAYIGASAAAKTYEWYFDVKGGSFSGGRFTFYHGATSNIYYTQQTVSEIGVIDGRWHCYEFRMKLNTNTGGTDGELHFWIDGVEKYVGDGGYPPWTLGVSNKNWGVGTGDYFTSPAVPAIGNLTDGTWNFAGNEWYAIEFDDYVVSTTYVGPGDATGPSPPRNVRIISP